ncbi:MAG: sulfotransferase domain-containing protein [Gammaproteobacteria bacterium]|nr:sulfotransferase domain-containing protein [Gammaproteobacteria bacterium]
MSEKTFFYLAGLPRTGSTVLGEILNQNPQIHVSPASPLSEIVSDVIAKWRMNNVTLRAYKHPEQLPNVWRGIRDGMYRHRAERFIIDKSWAWHMNDAINSTRDILGEEMKVICTVDDIADCVASFIMRIRSNPDYVSYIDDYLRQQRAELNDANRCRALMDARIPTSVGWCYENLKQTWQGNNRKNLLLIERRDLVADPDATLDRIYAFLEIPAHRGWGEGETHVFDRIEKEITEDDGAAYGIPDLHQLGPRLRDRSWRAKDVLGNQLFFKYKRLEFWRPKKRAL